MKKYRKFTLPVLLTAAALTLGACGGQASGAGDQRQDSGGGMQGMKGMDHGQKDAGGMAASSREMVMENGEYSDRAFIDAMVPHHQGAVDMAEVAVENAEHDELKSLAEDIVSAQEAEIEDLRAIKREEFGTSEIPSGMSQEEMDAMGMTDPAQLADKRPFDRAFIDAMTPHHRSAITMAEVAMKESDNPQVKEIAQDIVDAQKREIAQMERWREQWYPQG